MARSFVAASNQRLVNTATFPFADLPFTVAIWFNTTSTAVQGIISLPASGGISANGGYELEVVTDEVWVYAKSAGASEIPSRTEVLISTNTWVHVVYSVASTTDRKVYVNGNLEGSQTDAISSNPLAEIHVGERYFGGSPGNRFDGQIGRPAIWRVALDGTEAATLAGGASPTEVRCEDLIWYTPLIGDDPEPDLVGDIDLTVFGATYQADPEEWAPDVWPCGSGAVEDAGTGPLGDELFYFTSYSHAAAITPSDSAAINYRALLVTGAGNVRLVSKSGNEVTIAVIAGQLVPIAVTKVFQTNTTATVFGLS